MAYAVGHVARLARVSVRALHHYDAIGLVRPSGRSRAGYRLYTDRDLERLQEVLFFRELGFKLEDIARIVADPKFDRRTALVEQRARLRENADRASALLRLVDKTIACIDQGAPMKPEEMFDGFDHARHEQEAEARWGNTTSYAITAAFAEAMGEGTAPNDARAMDLAERHRMHIDRWFYPCSPRMHVGLGEMYVGDARFAETYEKRRAGLTAYVCEAFRANAERMR
jgi:DNA-binding transcriptional MerR regulator